MKTVLILIVLSISTLAFADESSAKELVQANVLSEYVCTYTKITYIALYEDEAYTGPTSTLKKKSLDVIVSSNAIEAVKEALRFIQTMKVEKNSKIDPLSIHCKSKR